LKISSRQILKIAGEAEAKRSSGLNSNYKYSQSKIMNFLKLAEVFGAEAVVYHGSHSPPEEFLDSLKNNSFKPGSGSGGLYGKGLYTIHDLSEGRTAGEESRYGDYVYKLKANLYGFISFDPDITEKIYGKKLQPSEQYKLFGVDDQILKSLRKLENMYDINKQYFSSVLALKASHFLRGRVKGIIYTGKQDGRCALFYDAETVVPLGWNDSYDAAYEDDWKPFIEKSDDFVGRGAIGNFRENIYVDHALSEIEPKTLQFLDDLSDEDFKDPKISFKIHSIIKREASQKPFEFLKNFKDKEWAKPYREISAYSLASNKPKEFVTTFSGEEWVQKSQESLGGKSYMDVAAENLIKINALDFISSFAHEDWISLYLDIAVKSCLKNKGGYEGLHYLASFEGHEGYSKIKKYIDEDFMMMYAKKEPYNFIRHYEIYASPEDYLNIKDYLSAAERNLATSNPAEFLDRYAGIDWAQEKLQSLGGKSYRDVAAEDYIKNNPSISIHYILGQEWTSEKLESLGGKSLLDISVEAYANLDEASGAKRFLEDFSDIKIYNKKRLIPYLSIAAEVYPKESPEDCYGFLNKYSEKEWAKPYIDVAANTLVKEDPEKLLGHLSEKPWAAPYIDVAAGAYARKDPKSLLVGYSKYAWANKPVESLGGKTWKEFAAEACVKEEPCTFLSRFSKEPWAAPYIDVAAGVCIGEGPEEFIERFILYSSFEKPWLKKPVESLGGKNWKEFAAEACVKKEPRSFLIRFSKEPWAAPYIDVAAEVCAGEDPDGFIRLFSKEPWAKKRVESLGGKTWVEFAKGKLAERELEEQKNASKNPINANLTKLAKTLKSLGLHDDYVNIISLYKEE
jgi:hypothetical protein